MNLLETILHHKREEVRRAQVKVSLPAVRSQAEAMPAPRSFAAALNTPGVAIIAEVKRASPSRGTIVADFDHVLLAREYEEGGAHALSVLTDEKFFGGRNEFIAEIKAHTALPILRKEFIIEEYQVFESRVLGADALLLIVRAMDAHRLRDLYQCATSLGLDVIVETHTPEEIDVANALEAAIIGINNRDLASFNVSLDTSLRLRPLIRSGAISVSESGLRTAVELRRLQEAGFHAVLVGEGLLTWKNRSEALRALTRE